MIFYRRPLTPLAPNWPPHGGMASALHVLVIPLVALHILAIGASALAEGKLVTRMVTGGTGPAPKRTQTGLACFLCVFGAQPVAAHPVLLMFDAIALMAAFTGAPSACAAALTGSACLNGTAFNA